MDHIFIFNLTDFFEDNEFIDKISFLCKHSKIERRRKLINYKRSCKLFNNSFQYKNYQLETLQNFLTSDIDLCEILKDIIEDLLDETLLERAHISTSKHYILLPKYYNSSIIYNYKINGQLDKNNIIFDYNSCIKKNIKICSTYRLPKIQKKILVNNYHLAKALIY